MSEPLRRIFSLGAAMLLGMLALAVISTRALTDKDSEGFLAEDDRWQTPYWDPASPKSHQRRLYATVVGDA